MLIILQDVGRYRLTFYSNGTLTHSMLKKLRSDKQQTSGSWRHYLARISKNERSWILHGQSTLKPHCKAYAVFKTREKKPHAQTENLNVMWGSPQAISFPDSIIDNCSYKAVVQISVKSMDEISVTIQIMAPKQDCPALGITNVFQYFTN